MLQGVLTEDLSVRGRDDWRRWNALRSRELELWGGIERSMQSSAASLVSSLPCLWGLLGVLWLDAGTERSRCPLPVWSSGTRCLFMRFGRPSSTHASIQRFCGCVPMPARCLWWHKSALEDVSVSTTSNHIFGDHETTYNFFVYLTLPVF
jgi:hypothetical protein